MTKREERETMILRGNRYNLDDLNSNLKDDNDFLIYYFFLSNLSSLLIGGRARNNEFKSIEILT